MQTTYDAATIINLQYVKGHITFTGHTIGIKVVSMIAGTNKHIIETEMVANVATVVSTIICIYVNQPLWIG